MITRKQVWQALLAVGGAGTPGKVLRWLQHVGWIGRDADWKNGVLVATRLEQLRSEGMVRMTWGREGGVYVENGNGRNFEASGQSRRGATGVH